MPLLRDGVLVMKNKQLVLTFKSYCQFFYALKDFCSNCSQCHIGVQSDYFTAVSYIQFIGGMSPGNLDTLAIEIWTGC